MKIAVFTGSFDPFTNGHLDIVRKASKLFDSVHITVMINSNKNYRVSVEKRKLLIEKSVATISNIIVSSWSGLATDYCKQVGANYIVRGVRNSVDCVNELEMANVNYAIGEIETVLLICDGNNHIISSSLIKELIVNNGDISKFVPREIKEDILELYR